MRCGLASMPALVLALAAACAGGPTPPKTASPEPQPPPAQPPQVPVPVVAAAPTPPTTRHVVRLENGVTAIVTTATGRQATLEFGVSAGASFLAHGAAELAAAVLVDAADPSQGRPSLRQAIARMGGTLQVHVGPLTSWIDLRVPGDRWRNALVALRSALQSPPWSRSQIERIREQVVAERTAALRHDPAAFVAKLLLLGESGGADNLLGLLDRDPGEITLFLSRAYQPDRALLAIEVPDDGKDAAAELAKSGSVAFAAWAPPAPASAAVPLLDRKFVSGLHWSPATTPAAAAAPCRVALLTLFAGPAQAGSAEELLLLSCFSLGGAGGRLEQMQREHGLGHVRWQGGIAQTPDAAGLLLTTEVEPQEVAALWRTVELARASLRDVPPSPSELAVAGARAPLTARLLALDDGSRVRATTMMALAGNDFRALDQRVAFVLGLKNADLSGYAQAFLDRPFAMVVVGGEVPADLDGVRRFEVLPVGYGDEHGAAQASAPRPAAQAQPWLDLACGAVGGAELLRRLTGWQYEAAVHAEAPAMTESVTWSADGSLSRTRNLLGQDVVTKLDGTSWSERLGTTVRSLDSRQAAGLRREMQRHPLALLAAHARGELTFRTIAQRDVGDRTVVVLEANGDRFERLRLHVDTQSHLVRAVETVETLPDGTTVHLEDAWQDYRTVAGLRVPHHRLTTQDDGQNRIETVFAKWSPTLRID